MLKSDLESRFILRFLWLSLMVALLSAGCGLTGDSDSPVNEEPPTDLPTGTIVIRVETIPTDQDGHFSYDGIPKGTISNDSALVLSNLQPGSYATTQLRSYVSDDSDPTDDQENRDDSNPPPSSPDFNLTGISCDDETSPTPSGGDVSGRTVVFNLDPGETVTCTFTNTKIGTAVISAMTEPEGAEGAFQYTSGWLEGTVPVNGSLVRKLEPGTYSIAQVDPKPNFDLTQVECDDEASPTPSVGDANTRLAFYYIDPGEVVTCVFTNTQRGTAIIRTETDPSNRDGEFIFSGVSQGSVKANDYLEIPNLQPGTYTSTQGNPEPSFELTEVTCDDEKSTTPSEGEVLTRTAVFNIDPGETVTCTFLNTAPDAPSASLGPDQGENINDPDDGSETGEGINPFDDPDTYLADFPLPESLPPGAGNELLPLSGPWQVTHFSGQMDCGVMSMNMAEIPPEPGTLTVSEDGQKIVGSGLLDSQGVPVIMNAASEIKGRFTGVFDGTHEGIPVEINYYWQVITQEYIVGYLTSSFTQQGTTCEVYRPFELVYDG